MSARESAGRLYGSSCMFVHIVIDGLYLHFTAVEECTRIHVV